MHRAPSLVAVNVCSQGGRRRGAVNWYCALTMLNNRRTETRRCLLILLLCAHYAEQQADEDDALSVYWYCALTMLNNRLTETMRCMFTDTVRSLCSTTGGRRRGAVCLLIMCAHYAQQQADGDDALSVYCYCALTMLNNRRTETRRCLFTDTVSSLCSTTGGRRRGAVCLLTTVRSRCSTTGWRGLGTVY